MTESTIQARPESGYRGVRGINRDAHGRFRQYGAYFCGRYLGSFPRPEDAARAYDAAASARQGTKAKVNFPGEPTAVPPRNPSRERTRTHGIAAPMPVRGGEGWFLMPLSGPRARGMSIKASDCDIHLLRGIHWVVNALGYVTDTKHHSLAGVLTRARGIEGVPRMRFLNGDRLDFRRGNFVQNTPMLSVPQPTGSRNKHGFRGVMGTKHDRSGAPTAFIAMCRASSRTQPYIGTFDTAEDAARAYDHVAAYSHGPHAVLNFPGEASAMPARRNVERGSRIPGHVLHVGAGIALVPLSGSNAMGRSFRVSEADLPTVAGTRWTATNPQAACIKSQDGRTLSHVLAESWGWAEDGYGLSVLNGDRLDYARGNLVTRRCMDLVRKAERCAATVLTAQRIAEAVPAEAASSRSTARARAVAARLADADVVAQDARAQADAFLAELRADPTAHMRRRA